MYEPQYVTAWRRSRRCGDTSCVEVAQTDVGVAIRDSKNPLGAPLHMSPSQFAAFVTAVQSGGYDDADGR